MKKVLIIGSKGMAGHVVTSFFKESGKFIVADISRDNKFFESTYTLDVMDIQTLNTVINEYAPDYIVNCIGILNKDAEENPDKAIFINGYLPHFLAKKGDRSGFKLIHISTDCVFSGKTGNYSETSVTDGAGFYARSKAIGEVNYGQHLTIRTSIIGPELRKNGIGLFDWFMRQTGEIKGFKNVIWTGVTTQVLAQAIIAGIMKEIGGLHHLVNGEKINKYDLLSLIKTISGKNHVSIIPDDTYKIDKSLLPGKDVWFEVPEYESMLKEMYDWIVLHPEPYDRYFR